MAYGGNEFAFEEIRGNIVVLSADTLDTVADNTDSALDDDVVARVGSSELGPDTVGAQFIADLDIFFGRVGDEAATGPRVLGEDGHGAE